MKSFILYEESTGEVQRWGQCEDDDLELQAGDGLTQLEFAGTRATCYVTSGVPTEYTAEQMALKANRPPYAASWDNTSMSWTDQRSLDEMKVVKNDEINTQRLAANQTYFVYEGKQIATDLLSRSDIDAVNGTVSLTDALPDGFPGGWKCIDNSYVTIPDTETWIAFYSAMVTQGLVNFAHAQALKATLAAATTAAEIDAILW